MVSLHSVHLIRSVQHHHVVPGTLNDGCPRAFAAWPRMLRAGRVVDVGLVRRNTSALCRFFSSCGSHFSVRRFGTSASTWFAVGVFRVHFVSVPPSHLPARKRTRVSRYLSARRRPKRSEDFLPGLSLGNAGASGNIVELRLRPRAMVLGDHPRATELRLNPHFDQTCSLARLSIFEIFFECSSSTSPVRSYEVAPRNFSGSSRESFPSCRTTCS